MDTLKGLWPDFDYMEHQQIGIRWMLEKEAAGTGALLCDDMGLGKTIQIAGLIKNQPHEVRQKQETLIIAPVAVLQQWKTVFQRSGIQVWVPKKGGLHVARRNKGGFFFSDLHHWLRGGSEDPLPGQRVQLGPRDLRRGSQASKSQVR